LNESGLSYSTTFNYTLTDVFSKNVTVQCKTNDPTLTITSFTASSPASVGSPVTFSAQTTSSGFNITDNFTWKFYLKESDYPATPCATATTTYDIPNASQTCTYTSTFVGNAKVEVTRGGVSKTRTVGVGITWPNTTSFAAGVTHSLLGKSDGSLWVTGAGNWGALGTGETSYSSWNQIAPFFLNNNKVKYVDAGSQSSYAVMDDNSLWVTGDHRGGQLGIGMAYQYITSWQSILTGVKTVSASVCGSHALVLKTDGTVWSAGSNVNGSLGVGDTAKRESWTPTGLSNVKDVAAGCSFSVALKNDGTVWVTGDNTYGALGLGDWNHRYSWTQTTLANVAAVSAGQHSMALKNDGTVWATGYNNAGGLGLGDGNHRNSWVQTASNAKYVSVGAYHSFIVKNDGVLWCTGYNDRDQLGMSDTTSRSVWTQNPLSNVQTISANGSHSFALDKDGKLLATGYDSVGQLGFPLSSHVQTWQQSATR
ncbi:MAG: Regulator of chromosome condensation RCC1, partial [candidate division CPR2 bacterium GW2011_GWC1_41_48]